MPIVGSAQSEEGQDKHDDHDQSHEVDDAVHGDVPCADVSQKNAAHPPWFRRGTFECRFGVFADVAMIPRQDLKRRSISPTALAWLCSPERLLRRTVFLLRLEDSDEAPPRRSHASSMGYPSERERRRSHHSSLYRGNRLGRFAGVSGCSLAKNRSARSARNCPRRSGSPVQT